LFLFVHLCVCSVSFADEVVAEVIDSVVPAEIAPIITDVVPAIEPVVEIVPEITEEENTTTTPEVNEVLIPEVISPTETFPEENNIDPVLEEVTPEISDIISEEIPPVTEEIPVTVVAEEEVIVISEPPAPEPEPWQPSTVDNSPDLPEGRIETHSDPVFLAKNSVYTRRMAQSIAVDLSAKHRCKVDVFRTDISDVATSILSVKFYGTSLLSSYDAEIGSLPNGIDVKFAKNNDYLYDFYGKETTLELIVNNQDDSLTGDFTIPIIYTAKGKKESSVICQLNILNDEEEIIVEPLVPEVPPVLDPVQEFVETILDVVISEPVAKPVITESIPTAVEEILEILIPIEALPAVSPPKNPPVALPELEGLPKMELIPDVIPVEPPPEPVAVEPAVEIPPTPSVEPSIPTPDVSPL
jgi:hypothetical protein